MSVGWIASCLLLPACSLFFPTSVPIPVVDYPLGQTRADHLLIILPGRGDEPEDFQKAGFVDILRESGLSVDVVAVDAHFGYYYQRSLLPRLTEDVIEPALARGYQHIWLLGVSMGGLGALLFAQAHPEWIEGLLLLAPFLGDEDVISEIESAGGLAAWTPPAELDPDDYQRKLWTGLKPYATGGTNLPKILLGWGNEDDFAQANQLLAALLPPAQVFQTQGGHEWQPWRELLSAFLKSGVLSGKKN